MPATYRPTRVSERFVLKNSRPISLALVRRDGTFGPQSLYDVVADYGWGNVIVCTSGFYNYALTIAETFGIHLGVPVVCDAIDAAERESA